MLRVSLDVRVLRYKHERSLNPFAPRLAVVVQRQIESDVAGVGFSMNPVTNDYDEAVIAASWGLGTAVVEGRVSADHFVADKISGRIIAESRGDKKLSVRLASAGTVEQQEPRAAERALSDSELRALTSLIVRIESLFECPVDVEWAYADATLHVPEPGLLRGTPVASGLARCRWKRRDGSQEFPVE